MNNHPGLFVVFEGIDGSGTTTVSRRVHEILAADHSTALWTNEPSDSEYGTKARHLLRVPQTQPIQLAMLFALDRWHHCQFVLQPALDRGQLVVCDRYFLSSLAYQRQDGVDGELVESMNPPLRPDLTIFLSCPVEVAEQRRLGRSIASDRFEVTDRQRQIAQNYEDEIEWLEIDETYGLVVKLDATAPIGELVEASAEIIRAELAERRARGLSPRPA